LAAALASRGTTQLLPMPPAPAAQGLQGLHGLAAPQGLHGFAAAQGLQGFLAAQGLHGFLAAQGLQGFLAAQGFDASCAASPVLNVMVSPLTATPTPTMSGRTVPYSSLVFRGFIPTSETNDFCFQ
jgi:hypothetical protein